MPMRWILPSLLVLAGCSSLPTIPAPWEPTETQLAEPTPVREAATPVWTRIGTSIRGKPIEAVTLGSGPRRVYVIGGMQGDEPEGPAAAAKLPGLLLGDLIAESGERATIRIVRDMNPDGTSSGTRGNTRGIDLNRNWPSRDYHPETRPAANAGRRAASELEINTVLDDLKAFKPDVVVVLGSAATGRGPAVIAPDRAPAAYDFSAAARREDPRWIVDRGPATVLPGSVQSLVGKDMKKVVLTVDLRRGSDTSTNARAIRAGLLTLTGTAKAAPRPTTTASEPLKAPILGGR
jgi:murein peptide amidase A